MSKVKYSEIIDYKILEYSTPEEITIMSSQQLKVKETDIRYKITYIQTYLSYLEKINHIIIKQRLGILYGELDNILDELEKSSPNWETIDKNIEIIYNLARQI